jgi:putative ABC transport system permease protein
MDVLIADLRYALRRLLKSPGFTLVAALALALGIGANTAIFSAVNAVLLRPLPYPDAGRLAFLSETSKDMDYMSVSLPNFRDWLDQNRVFEELGLVRGQGATLTGGDAPQRLEAYIVTSGYFRALGVPPLLGRPFAREDDEAGAARTAVLNHRFWAAALGSDPGVVGRTLVLDGAATTVVGVMPAGFEEDEVDLYLPLGPHLPNLPVEERGNHPGFYGIARLRDGVSLAGAQAGMSAIARRLAEHYPDSNSGNGVRVASLTDELVGEVRPALLVLLGAVGFVLLIACANVANLLLARAEARTREIAIRTSLGACRGRLLRQLLTESVVLALLGGLAGLLLAFWAVGALVSLNPGDVPRIEEIGIDWRVLLFALGVSLLTGVLFGLAPALRASRPDLNASLKEGATAAISGMRRPGLRSALVVSEVALTLVLLVGAGLMLRSFERLRRVDPGFRDDRVLVMRAAPSERAPLANVPPDQERSTEAWSRWYADVVEAAGAVPGVEAAAVTSTVPMEGGASESGVVAAGQPMPTSPAEVTLVQFQTVSPGYFDVLGIPLLRGRSFEPSDDARAPLAAVIDETLAERLWPGEEPLGRRIAFEFRGQLNDDPRPIWRTVVGVVRHVRHYGLAEVVRPQVYAPVGQVPIWQDGDRPMGLLVRTRRDGDVVTGAIREAIARLDPAVPIFEVRTMESVLAEQLAQPRFSSMLLGAFAGIALTLAAVGIYGLVAYTVSRRTREIGLRMALGAARTDVLRMVVRQGMTLVAVGLAVGLALALALSRVLGSLLYEVSAWDPATFAAVAVVLLAIALVASWIPARRATRVDPLAALRYE